MECHMARAAACVQERVGGGHTGRAQQHIHWVSVSVSMRVGMLEGFQRVGGGGASAKKLWTHFRRGLVGQPSGGRRVDNGPRAVCQ